MDNLDRIFRQIITRGLIVPHPPVLSAPGPDHEPTVSGFGKINLMAGSQETGIKAAKTIKRRYGNDFYRRVGSLSSPKTARNDNKGFANEEIGEDGLTGRQRASLAGRKGGLKSRRNKRDKSRANKALLIPENDKAAK